MCPSICNGLRWTFRIRRRRSALAASASLAERRVSKYDYTPLRVAAQLGLRQGEVLGLLGDKKAYVFAARGGLYAGTALDTQTSYVRDFLRFIGIDTIEFVYAEGLHISAQSKAAGLASAAAQIERLAA